MLIIVVAFYALYMLGVFGGGGLSSGGRAAPGSCQVLRPSGAGNNQLVSLNGECQGQLPQYVAYFGGLSGGSSVPGITIPYSSYLEVTGPLTVSWWFSSGYPSTSNFDTEMIDTRQPDTVAFDVQLEGGASPKLHGDIGDGSGWITTAVDYPWTFSQSTWYYVTETFNSIAWTIYVNGTSVATGTYLPNTPNFLNSDNYAILGYGSGGGAFHGQMANVQVYSAALSANAVKALYLEGIGGAPVDLGSIVGWWPLNGNANDYSGNSDDGNVVSTGGGGASFNGSWPGSYTAP
jgi:hypothetical protein